ncbi:MAG: diacylglycerol/lipid kinase family protein [Micrococcales bacterium]
MSKNRVAVIYYPDRVHHAKLAKAVESETSSLGFAKTIWLPTDELNTGAKQATDAIAKKATHILVAGGDGTIRAVLEAVALNGATVSVGVIPGGTGNVLARNLGVDLGSLATQVRRAIAGIAHHIDLGLARIILADGTREEKLFAVMGGLGLDAKIMLSTDPAKKRRLGWIAYVESGFKAIPLKYRRMSVQVDSREPQRVRVLTLLVGNVGWLPGKISMMPDAAMDDGIIDVAAIGPYHFWQWVDFWSRVTIGNNVVRTSRVGRKLLDATADVKTLENMAGKKIRVMPDEPVELQLDGDAVGFVAEVEFEVMPRAILIRS